MLIVNSVLELGYITNLGRNMWEITNSEIHMLIAILS